MKLVTGQPDIYHALSRVFRTLTSMRTECVLHMATHGSHGSQRVTLCSTVKRTVLRGTCLCKPMKNFFPSITSFCSLYLLLRNIISHFRSSKAHTAWERTSWYVIFNFWVLITTKKRINLSHIEVLYYESSNLIINFNKKFLFFLINHIYYNTRSVVNLFIMWCKIWMNSDV